MSFDKSGIQQASSGLVLALLSGALCSSCASDQREARSAESSSASDALDETRILNVFVGTDASAMTELGRKIEGTRPKLSTALLENMLAFLAHEPDRDSELRMLRAMLFRSTAVVIGSDSRQTLLTCASTLPNFSRFCQDILSEIEY